MFSFYIASKYNAVNEMTILILTTTNDTDLATTNDTDLATTNDTDLATTNDTDLADTNWWNMFMLFTTIQYHGWNKDRQTDRQFIQTYTYSTSSQHKLYNEICHV